MKRRTEEIVIVSPYAHHPGHHWWCAKELGIALAETGVAVTLLVAGSPVEGSKNGPRPFRLEFCAPRLAGQGNGIVGRAMARLSLSRRHNVEMAACLFRLPWLPARIVHFIDATHLLLFAYVLLSRRTVVYTVFGYPDFDNKASTGVSRIKARLTQWMLRAAVRTRRFAMVGETEAVGAAWRPYCGSSIHVIPHAVTLPPRLVDQRRARGQLGVEASALVLLMFGTHRKGKDYRVVFEAAGSTPRNPLRLLFVGSVFAESNLSGLILEHPGVAVDVVDRMVSDEEAGIFFAACDAVVLPYEEGFDRGSGVLVLACKHARPVIATDTGFLRKFIEEHRTGFLFKGGNAADFARALSCLTDMTPAQHAALDARIRATAELFSWAQTIPRYQQLYRTPARGRGEFGEGAGHG